MAITSASTPQDVLDQYNNNLSWDNDTTKAQNALEALRWLLVNRPSAQSMGGKSLNYDSLQKEKEKLETILGVGMRRANGRSRMNEVDFQEPAGVQ